MADQAPGPDPPPAPLRVFLGSLQTGATTFHVTGGGVPVVLAPTLQVGSVQPAAVRDDQADGPRVNTWAGSGYISLRP